MNPYLDRQQILSISNECNQLLLRHTLVFVIPLLPTVIAYVLVALYAPHTTTSTMRFFFLWATVSFFPSLPTAPLLFWQHILQYEELLSRSTATAVHSSVHDTNPARELLTFTLCFFLRCAMSVVWPLRQKYLTYLLCFACYWRWIKFR